jgi:hypothetical protein
VAEDSGIRKCRVTGRNAHVWRLKYASIPSHPGTPQALFPEPVKGRLTNSQNP